MKRPGLIALLLIVLLLVSGLAAAQDTPSATPASGHEIVRVLAYGLDVFEPETWRMAGAEESSIDTHVLWRYRQQEDLLFFFIHQPFEGPLDLERIISTYDAERFEVLLAHYAPYEPMAECQHDDLLLYEFRSKQEGVTRILRYWLRQVGDQMVLSVNGITPLATLDTFDAYAERLFPELPSCEAA